MKNENRIEEIAKRRGFFWQSSEIYGGLSGFYDYAHLGTLMKKKLENIWRKYFLNLDDNFYEIETTNIMPENVFRASGHIQSFVDPIVKCKKCGNIERADQLIEEELKETFEGLTSEELLNIIKKHNIKCNKCNGSLEEIGTFNLMFSLMVGNNIKAYLRPETAQGVYINFKREFECLRKKLPFGLAIIGKAFRNEISPRNLLMRMREFTQAELQIFFDPEKINEHKNFDEMKNYKLRIFPVSNRKTKKIEEMSCDDVNKKLHLPKFYVYYMGKIQQFYLDILKFPYEKFRFYELSDEEKAFYNKYHWDIELEFSFGWKEVAGLHYRTDNDLIGHQKVSKQDLSIFFNGRKFIPHVVELSFGIDRNILALLDIFYKEEKERTIFLFPRLLAPFDCAVFPLIKRYDLEKKAEEIKKILNSMNYIVFYDDSGSIGRRYRRMDEIGVSCCITIDHKTLEDNTVTIRDRDSMKQIRVKINDLCVALFKFLNGEKLEKLGI
ncbi:MAG: glycine--tRNA ligase [Candidatus Aenigmatarchaeota archaeon]